MLNHSGGWILMDVSDNGEILGVEPTKAADKKKAIMDAINNPEFLLCPFFIPEILPVEGKTCIALNIPCCQFCIFPDIFSVENERNTHEDNKNSSIINYND